MSDIKISSISIIKWPFILLILVFPKRGSTGSPPMCQISHVCLLNLKVTSSLMKRW
ncbi:hypothetical protein GcC1_c14444o20 [Golovinomyces cichoracearum]|uniref:Uncharacterized protein n=1 Tax=Golovinomyces cichoracearum TaxID=62708 RepID=A0A420J0Z8_9PEZI|nr:hypothetical protein GcC1_c14444o20 [Golovinomyces cichoracearum]